MASDFFLKHFVEGAACFAFYALDCLLDYLQLGFHFGFFNYDGLYRKKQRPMHLGTL